jgi:HSP20 family protein
MAQLLPESFRDALRRLREDSQRALDRLPRRRASSPDARLPARWNGPIEHLRTNIHEAVNRWLPGWRGRRSNPQNGDGWIQSMLEQGGPPIDVEEKDDEIIIRAEIPGLDKDDFKVEVADDRLILRGQKKLESEERGRGYYYAAHRFGAFTRVIPLPSEVDVKKVSAKYKNGLLRVVLPKTRNENARRIEVRATQ